MKVTLTNRRKWLLGAGVTLLLTATPSFALFGIGDIVFDPTSYASLVQQLTTLQMQYNMVKNNLTHFSLKQQWQRAGVLEGILWALCEDLLARGQLDLSESFIDATFAGAKKGALQLVQHAAGKGPRSWQLQTAMVFLSPPGLRALRRMKPGSSKLLLNSGLPLPNQNE